MLAAFVLLAITASPIAAETDALLDSVEAHLGSGDVPAGRAACRDAAHALATAIDGLAGLADPDPYVARVLGAWRVLDAAIHQEGVGRYAIDNLLLTRTLAEIQAINVEVAQQVAFEAQP